MSRRLALAVGAIGMLATLAGATTAVGAGETTTVEDSTVENNTGEDGVPGAGVPGAGVLGDGIADDDIPAQCRTIIGCPDAGPEPENPGDRGGYAQLLTLGVLAVGIGFIMTKVFRAARASQPDPVE